MSQRISVVTGAAKGIGRAIAEALLDAGDAVIGLDVDADAMAGAPFEGRVADCSDLGVIDRTFAEIAAAHGRIDVLVNNAGVTRRADMMDLTEADWDRIVGLNAKGVFFCQQAAARQMLDQSSAHDGRIINIASIAGKGYPDSSNAIYAASKGAVITMTRMAAHRLGPHGITVNAICPGITETDIFQGIVARDAETRGVPYDDVHAEKVANVPMRRTNTTAEIASLVVFLASAGARNITGQALNIDGGLVMD